MYLSEFMRFLPDFHSGGNLTRRPSGVRERRIRGVGKPLIYRSLINVLASLRLHRSRTSRIQDIYYDSILPLMNS